MKKGPGSHNRIAKKVIKYQDGAKNRFAQCRCIIHRKADGSGTELELIYFNRQGDGSQSMCQVGKTLIDSLKHKFWRVANAFPLMALVEEDFPNTSWAQLKKQTLLRLPDAAAVIEELEASDALETLRREARKGVAEIFTVLKAGNAIEDALKVKDLGFYRMPFDSPEIAEKEFRKLDEGLKNLTTIEIVKPLEPLIYQLVDRSPEPLYVRESANVDYLNFIGDVGINWSKRNDVYTESGQKIGLRGPFHNTLKKGASSGDRMVRYLVEIDRNAGPPEVNRWISEHRSEGTHADHVMPLALGGRHTLKNIVFLPGAENIKKKDRLTFEAFKTLTQDVPGLMGMVNRNALPIIMEALEEIGVDEKAFHANINRLTAQLKAAMYDRIESFGAMSREEKLNFLKKARPDLSPAKRLAFLERFKRSTNDRKN